MKTEHRTSPKPLSGSDLERYLKSIKFDERSGQGSLSDDDLKKILHDNLEKYFQGKVTQSFVIDLGSAIYEECPEDDTLLSVTCVLSDLVQEMFGNKDVAKSSQKKDRILREAFEVLRTDRKE